MMELADFGMTKEEIASRTEKITEVLHLGDFVDNYNYLIEYDEE